ncbi:MAG: YHS domain-containing protein, partial [Granulicella sp.]
MTSHESLAETFGKVVDPVCGMKILPEQAASKQDYEGQTYYFCGKSCMEKFNAEPASYASPKPVAKASPAAVAKPIIDPVCGMQVDPVTAAGMVEYGGVRYFFCSKGCVSKFQADPGKYLQPISTEEPERPVSRHSQQTEYICPMHPEVHKDGPGDCPKCGMALEPETLTAPTTHTKYTCPMHPQIIRDAPGNCPICGMTLEPMTVTGVDANPELDSMTRRFWISAALTLPLLAIMVSDFVPSHPIQELLKGSLLGWFELAIASPVVLWGGWPFFQRGWTSLVSRNLNMFTLISIGAGSAYLYSLAAVFMPQLFPASFRDMSGQLGLYFEASAVITVLVLLGQVLELKARSQTSGAI